jgi:hypothetical protein
LGNANLHHHTHLPFLASKLPPGSS